MLKFPATLHNFRKTVTGENHITLSVDSSQSKELSEILSKDPNAMFMVYLEDLTPESNVQEDSLGVKERFARKFHLLLSDLSVLKGTTQEAEKKIIRDKLIKEGIIEKSTTELDVKQLAKLCAALEKSIAEYGG